MGIKVSGVGVDLEGMSFGWSHGRVMCKRKAPRIALAVAILAPLSLAIFPSTAGAAEAQARTPRGTRAATPVIVAPPVDEVVTPLPTPTPVPADGSKPTDDLLLPPDIAAAAAPDLSAAAITLRAGWTQRTDAPSAGSPMTPFIEGMAGYSGWFRHTTPAIGNIDGDPQLEIVVGSLDGKIYAWNPDGTRVPGWPRNMDSPTTASQPINGSVVITDIDNNGVNEVIAANDNGWVFAFDGSGNVKPGWPQFTGYNADYPNNCGVKVCAGVNAAPTVVDLDGDGYAEVIVGGFGHKLFVWNHVGALLPGWPIDVWDGVSSSAAAADLNGDGLLDIIVGSDAEQNCSDCKPFGVLNRGGIYSAWNMNGTLIPGWPVAVDAFAWSSPAVADLDGNGTPEVVAGSGFFGSEVAQRGRAVTAWNANGTVRWQFGTNGAVIGSPVVADINNDGTKEIVFGDVDRSGGGISYLYVLNANGGLIWQSQGTTGTSPPAGFGAIFGSPVVADVTGDGVPEIITVDANWHLKIFANNGTPIHDFSTSFSMQNSPQVGDIDGNGTNELILASAAQNGYAGNIGTLAGQGEVFVFNTPGTGGARSAQSDRAFPQPGPQYVTFITAFRSRARIGLARARFTDTLIIDGANFANDTWVSVGGVAYPITYRSSTRLIVTAMANRLPRKGVLIISQSGGIRRKAYRL